MYNTVNLFIISNEIIYDINVEIVIYHSLTLDKANTNTINCKTEIHHNSPYFARTIIPVIYDESITNEEIRVKLNNHPERSMRLNNSVIILETDRSKQDFADNIIKHIVPMENDLDEDIDILLKIILSKSNFTREINEKYRKMDKLSLRGNPDLEFKYLLFSFKNNGSLYHPSYYFNYSMKLLEFIRREQITQNGKLFPFLRKFILVVLNYFRSDGLFGPHAAISYFLYFHYKIHVRCLPIDLTFDDEYHNSDDFLYMNFSFIENTISLTSQLALIWGYQSKCHALFMKCVKNINIISQYGESLKIMELRLRESTGALREDVQKFTVFSREFFPNLIGAHPLANQLLDYPISLSFIHELMRLKPLVQFPKDDKEVVKFSLPASMLANNILDEFVTYPSNARYDFSNPQVSSYRANVKTYFFENSQLKSQTDDIHQLQKPIITSFYGITSLYITAFTNQFDFTTVDLHDLMYISVSKNNPFFVLEKGILYRGYNISTDKMKGRDKSKYILVLAARDILTAEIPKEVTIIAESAFENCRSLTKVTFENDSLLTIIEDRAFYECINLTSIDFSQTRFLQKIGANAFQYSSIENLSLKLDQKNDLNTIGEFAFASCQKLKKVDIGESIYLSIKSFAFYKSAVEEASISCADSIYDYSFAKTNLKKINLQNLNYIGSYAFDSCQLKSLTIPRNLNFIPASIINHNSSFQTIDVNSQCPIFILQPNDYRHIKINAPVNQFYTDGQNKLLGSFLPEQKSTKTNLGEPPMCDDAFISPEMKTDVRGKYVYFISPEVKSLSNYDELKRIQEGAFMKSTLEKIDKDIFKDQKIDNLHRFNRFCFAYMKNLQIFDIYESRVKFIPDYCFFNSVQLKQVKLPRTVKEIGRFAFAFTNLFSINLSELNDLRTIKDFAFYKTRIRKLVIPSSVEYIGSHFYSNIHYKITRDLQLEGDEDPNDYIDDDNEEEEEDEAEDNQNGEEEEEEAEDEYDDEEKISIKVEEDDGSKIKHCSVIFKQPSKLKRIESFAFYNSTIRKIDLPPSLVEIGSFAFAKCQYLKLVKIPKNVRRIPDGLFKDSIISSITYEDINSIHYIGSSAFTGTKFYFFKVPPNISFIPDFCFLDNLILQYRFDKSLKIHEIKHQAFENPHLEIQLPLAATEKEKDSFDIQEFHNEDFVGNYAKEISQKNEDFTNYDEIIFDSNKKIKIKVKEPHYNPYEQNKKDIEEQQGTSQINIAPLIKLGNANRFKHHFFKTSQINEKNPLYEMAKNNSRIDSLATVVLYYEIASKHITHISISYSDSLYEGVESFLIEIDNMSKNALLIFKFFADNVKLCFLHEKDVEIFNNFFNCHVKSHYSPIYLLTEVTSLCNALKIEIPKRPSLFSISDAKAKELNALSTISCIYINIVFMKQESKGVKYGFNFPKEEKSQFIKLRLLSSDDFFEMFLMYNKEENTVISKQILTSKTLVENKFFDIPVCFRSKPKYDNIFEKITVTYSFPLSYSIRDILDGIRKKKMKIGQEPYKRFLKFNCIATYTQIFQFCARQKYTMADISSKTLFLSDSFNPLFIFIQRKEKENGEYVFNIKRELKRYWLLIYEIITNSSIEEYMEQFEKDYESIHYEKLQIKTSDISSFLFLNNIVDKSKIKDDMKDNKSMFHDFISQIVYSMCINPDKFDRDLIKGENSFDFIFRQFKGMWLRLNLSRTSDYDDFNSYLHGIETGEPEISDLPKI